MTDQEVLDAYRGRDSVWFFDYSGDPKAPHAELTGGLCSDAYVNSAPVMSDPELARVLVWQMVARLCKQISIYPDWIVGSAYAAITFSYELARQLGAKHGFTEKDPNNSKKMVWSRFAIPRYATVLQCEELITSFGTTEEVRRAVNEGNAEPVIWMSQVLAGVYRPARLGADPREDNLTALVRREVKSWKPEECPLCKNGSPRIRPKSYWAELTGKR